ncbi:MAG: MFS transporter [Steroidobacteraceae bacterium]|jgi:MFS family permease
MVRKALEPTSPKQIVFLLTLALLINYIDRGNLATAGPLLLNELKLSPTQLGTLLSAFYIAYAAAMVPAGWLADRYGAKMVLGFGVAIWSIATFTTGFVNSFASLLVLRLLLGLGESPIMPGTSKLIRTRVGSGRLGFANGVMGFGYQIGPAVGTFAGGLLMAHLGWRPVFILFGVLSLLWLLPWARVQINEPTHRGTGESAEAPRFGAILRQQALWGASLGTFGLNYSFFFTLAWLPTYLVKARGFSMEEMAQIAAPAYALCAVTAVIGGLWIDRCTRVEGSSSGAQKWLMVLGYLSGLIAMVGMALLPRNGSIACLYVYELFSGLASPCLYAAAQIFAGPSATARWVGIQNCCGMIAGILAPALTGALVDVSGSYVSAFIVAGAANVIGFIGWVLVMPRIAPVEWNSLAEAA